jgi:hypothetical protein
MTQMLPRNYIIGIIIFTFFIVGGVSILGMFASVDPTFTNDEKFTEFNQTFNKLNEVSTQVDNLEKSITEADTDFGAFGVLNALISSAWQSIKLLFSSLSFMDGAFEGLSSVFGVPGWIPALIITLITVSLVFAIFSAIFQREL